MVKAYFRYVYENTCGAVTGNSCQILLANKQFITAAGQYLIILNKATGETETHSVQDKNIEITSLAMINKLVIIGYLDGDIVIWDLVEKKAKGYLYGHKAAITCLVCNENSQQLYSGSQDTTIIIWDLASEELLLKLSGHLNAITSLQLIQVEDPFTAKLKVIVASGSKDGLVKLWDEKLEQSILTIPSNHTEVLSLGFITDEQILIIGTNSETLIFKRIIFDNEQKIQISLKDEGEFKRNAYSKVMQITFDQRKSIIFILTSDHRIETYKIKQLKQLKKKLSKQPKVEEEIQKSDIKYSQLIASFTTLHIEHKTRSMVVYQEIKKVNASPTTMIGLSFNKNVFELRRLTDEGLWQEEDDKTNVLQILGNQAPVRCLYLSENDQMLLALSGQECIVYDVVQCKVITRILHKNLYTTTVFLPKSRYILLGDSEGLMQIFDFHSGEEVQSIQAHQTKINNITYHKSPKQINNLLIILNRSTNNLLIMTSGLDRQIKFWEIFFQTETKKIQLVDTKTLYMNDDINHAIFSTKGDYFAVALLSNMIQIYYCDSYKLYIELYGHVLPVLSFAITSDDTLLISGGQDKNIKLWGMDFGDCKKSIKAHQDQVTVIQTVNETHYFFSGSKDRTIKYWDGDTYELILQFDECISEILSIAVGVIGDVFFIGGGDRLIRKFQQSKDQVYVQEEDEKRTEKMLLEDYQKNNQGLEQKEEKDDVTKQSIIQGKVPQLKTAEDIMNALEHIKKYRIEQEFDQEEKLTEEEKKNKLLMFNYAEPTEYLFKQLQNIPITSLRSVLKFMHIKYVSVLIDELKTDIAVKIYPQLTSHILNYLLIHEEGQLISSNESTQNLISLKTKLKLRLDQEKDTIGYNITAMQHFINRIQEDDQKWEFS